MAPELVIGAEHEALARMVHDLRSPLTVIRGLLFVLRREDPAPERRRQLDLIDGEVDRLARGLDGLLAPPPAPSSVTCLAAAARTAVERHRAAATARGVVLAARAPDGPMPVHADADSLARILDNLIGNALRYSPAGGDVRVSLRARGAVASLLVRDQGAGVPVEDRARIFRAGERGAAPRGPGHGLGLAICRDLAQRHGGTLELVPVGPGATFRLALPLASAVGDVGPAA